MRTPSVTNPHALCGRLLGAALIALISGCAAPPPPAPDPVTTILNSTGKSLAEVRYQLCGNAGEDWTRVKDSALRHGASVEFVIPADCINLIAVYEDGKVAGTQTGVKKLFPFRWVLY